jgi:hypothetical protein
MSDLSDSSFNAFSAHRKLHRCWDKISKKELPEVPQLCPRIFSRNFDLFARNFSDREGDVFRYLPLSEENERDGDEIVTYSFTLKETPVFEYSLHDCK